MKRSQLRSIRFATPSSFGIRVGILVAGLAVFLVGLGATLIGLAFVNAHGWALSAIELLGGTSLIASVVLAFIGLGRLGWLTLRSQLDDDGDARHRRTEE